MVVWCLLCLEYKVLSFNIGLKELEHRFKQKSRRNLLGHIRFPQALLQHRIILYLTFLLKLNMSKHAKPKQSCHYFGRLFYRPEDQWYGLQNHPTPFLQSSVKWRPSITNINRTKKSIQILVFPRQDSNKRHSVYNKYKSRPYHIYKKLEQ